VPIEIPPRDSHASTIWRSKYLRWLLIVISLFAVWSVWGLVANSAPTNNGTVESINIDRGQVVKTVRGYGRIRTINQSLIISQVDGVITHLDIEDGRELFVDQSILTLQNPLLEADLQAAELAKLEATATYHLSIADLERQQVQLELDVALAEVNLQSLESELSSLTTLYNSGLIAEMEYSRAVMSKRKAEIKLTALESQYSSFNNQLENHTRAFDYSLDAAQRRYEYSRAEVGALDVRSPGKGTFVAKDELYVGAFVSRGQVLGFLLDQGDYFAELNISASEADKVNYGQRVSLTVRNEEISGSVKHIHPKVENGRVRVDIELTGHLSIIRDNIDITGMIIVNKVEDTPRMTKSNYLALNGTARNASQSIPNKRNFEFGLIGDDYVQVIQ